MEFFTFNIISSVAKEKGCKKLLGTYKPTAKNIVVKDLFQDLGGQKIKKNSNEEFFSWEFDLLKNKAKDSIPIVDLVSQPDKKT